MNKKRERDECKMFKEKTLFLMLSEKAFDIDNGLHRAMMCKSFNLKKKINLIFNSSKYKIVN